MKLVNRIKRAMRGFGVELTRYSPTRSSAAQMQGLFQSLDVDLVLDVGANTGQYARLIRSGGYSGRIVSFEPLAQAHSELRRAADTDVNWEVAERLALGSEEGVVDLHVSANSQSSSILEMNPEHLIAAPESHYIATERVRLARLDALVGSLIGAHSHVFLKIDTQGFESEVLKGSTAILPSVVGIQLELSLVPMYRGERLFQQMLEFMASLGFKLVALWPAFVDPHTFRTLQMDGVFARDKVELLPAQDGQTSISSL